MFESLKKMNFGIDCLQWIKTFYTDINSIIVNNGNFSEQFNIEKGVRQGCPLSTCLILVCIDILASYIKNNENIKGIKIKEVEIKQTLIAGDSTFLNDG